MPLVAAAREVILEEALLEGPLAVRPPFVQNDARIRSPLAVCV
ncbi:MAG: hypothetical protein JWM10_5333 [Myxococcaceae bacterium]|nr:hypothetical protein [Myxococcaceae bacterium]